MIRAIQISALAITVLAATAGTAQAGLLIDAGPSSTETGFSLNNYVAGSEFTTSSAMTIRSLGWLDVEKDGLTQTHKVGLWDTSNQDLLASADVTPSSPIVPSAHPDSQWFMADIAPLSLPAGTYRVAGLVSPDGHLARSGDKIGNGVTISSGYVRNSPGDGFSYPDESYTTEAIRASLSTDPAGAVIPEPASVAFLALGAGAAGLTRRRRHRA